MRTVIKAKLIAATSTKGTRWRVSEYCGVTKTYGYDYALSMEEGVKAVMEDYAQMHARLYISTQYIEVGELNATTFVGVIL